MPGWSGWNIATSRLPEPLKPGELPPHAYVPGRTARHPEGFFDLIKRDVSGASELEKTTAWQAGLIYFDQGYFWECHEVLEAVWLAAPEGTPEREMAQAIIQLANARLKLVMERPKATLRLCDMVQRHLERCPQDQPVMGQQAANWQAEAALTRGDAEAFMNAKSAK